MKLTTTSKRITIVVLTMLMVLGYNPCFAEEAFSNPISLVKCFYRFIFSDNPLSDCPDIFFNADEFISLLPEQEKSAFPSDASSSEKVWSYYRKYRMFFETFGLSDKVDQKKELSGIQFSYLFRGVRDNEPFFDNNLYVIVFGGLSKGNKEGVIKQVSFLMVKNQSYGGGYLIDPFNIEINGMQIDFDSSFDRSENIYELLGLKERKGVAPPTQ